MEPLAPEDLVDDWSDLSTSSLGPGARLGRYELLLPIAYGGMARVWAARLHGQRGFSKLVAIKTILPHLAHSAEFERMFLDEARIAAGVHHPNVTEIYELGEEGHVLYLAMEWVNGESLVHVVRGLSGQGVQAIDPRLAARIAAEACAGLHAAHELRDDHGRPLNVVHRDVSPHNILVSIEGTVKVTDFGVAKALGQSHQATVAGQIKGKVAYMAPEILGSAAFDRRSDIFAVGCVLYEATTGMMPFRGGNDPQIMQAVLKGAYAPAPSVIRGYPLELAAIIDCALAADPRRRFATAEQMRIALEEWLVKSGPLVSPTDLGYHVRERLGPHLDKRREHVRAAMASAQEQETRGGVRPAAGQLPSQGGPPLLPTPAGQSHSGVVATSPDAYRARGPVPPMRSPTPGPVAVTAPPPVVQAMPSVHPPPRRQTSNARYAMAAAAGVTFALVVGGLAVALWLTMRAPSTRAPQSTLAVTASAKAVPSVPPPAAPPAKTTTTPIASAPPPVAAPSSSPNTVNVNDLPEAKPAWMEPQPAGGRWPAPPASAKNPALPANPYVLKRCDQNWTSLCHQFWTALETAPLADLPLRYPFRVRALPVSSALACLFVLAAGMASPRFAVAQDDGANDAASTSARARYNAGTKAFSEKRFVEAALNFEAAAADKASPVALYTAAFSWEQANVPERAADDYARALAVPGLPADKTGMARERLASLEGVLGAVNVVGPEGTRVQLDANTELAVPATLHASAGVHSLSARSSGRPIERRPVVLERGKTAKLDLATEPAPPQSGEPRKEPPPPPPPPPPPLPPPVDSGSGRRAFGFTAIGVGGAMLLSGVVLGSEAIGARDTYRGAPTQFAYDHASELQLWTDVAFIAGSVIAAGGVVLVVWPSSKASAEPAAKAEGVSLVPLPGGLLLKGAF